MIKRVVLLAATILLLGCDKPSDEHVFTLYSSYKNNRVHIATFDATPVSWKDKKIDEQFVKWAAEENFASCKKVANLLEIDWVKNEETNELKFWCEKGYFR